MAINLHTAYAKKIQSAFSVGSLIAGRLSTEYDFTGVKTVKVSIPQTVPMVDYDRAATANRYGTPSEMQDIVQELTLTQDKSFSMIIDKGNNADQSGTKEAGKMLALQISERAVPLMDTYVFKRLAELAGSIVGNATALTSETVCERISKGTEKLDDAEVPQSGRTLFVPASTYKLLKHSSEFLAVESLAEKAIAKGEVGLYDNMTVVKVPESRWPLNINFLIVHKMAATAPVKLNDTKLHTDPPGISGNLLEGRQYYDCFVFAPKCEGVYAEVDTSSGKGSVLAAPTISASGAFSGSGTGVSYRFTTDGTDPRYSETVKMGTSSDVVASGTVIRAYATKSGSYPSGISTLTIA